MYTPFKNSNDLLSPDLDEESLNLRTVGLNALKFALSAVHPRSLLMKSVTYHNNLLKVQEYEYNLEDFKNIYIIGAGKATAEMTFALEEILSKTKLDYKGVINIPEGLKIDEKKTTQKITIIHASHPIPNEEGLKGASLMMDLIKNSSKESLFFCLISGGGSALLPLPKEGLLLEELKMINLLLLESGASIHEINVVRKHLSAIKGGNLVKELFKSSKAKLISLIISDVIGDDIDVIASGPTAPDKSTFSEAIEILKSRNIYDKIPKAAKEILENGRWNPEMETPKPNDECFANVHNYVIGSVRSAIQSVQEYLSEEGFQVYPFPNHISGEARVFGENLCDLVKNNIYFHSNIEEAKNLALLGSGELTVSIKGQGTGGRNQEMLLSFIHSNKNKEFPFNFLIISVNLDGIEGNSDAMGALVDNFLIENVKQNNIETSNYLQNNDSNSFFKQMNAEIISGPTGCNVNDLTMVLIQHRKVD